MYCVVGQDYGLFLADEDPRKGVWLENGRTLEYYLLKPGVRTNTLFLCIAGCGCTVAVLW